MVIFSSDNGPERTGTREKVDDLSTGPGIGTIASVGTIGGHRGRKRSLLQGGIGVPFLARWPGKIPKDRIDKTTPITAVDLLPTFCSIAGVKLPRNYVPDGVDQSEALFGKAKSMRKKPIFWQWRFASRRGDNLPALAIREGDWKLIPERQARRIELFRFPQDRFEKHNRSKMEPGEVKRLRAMIDTWLSTIPAKPKSTCFSRDRSK